MSQGGVQITGICNGTSSFTSKGKIFHQLLVVVPGSNGVIQVSLQGEPDPDKYPVGKPIAVQALPTFFNGRVSGFALKQ